MNITSAGSKQCYVFTEQYLQNVDLMLFRKLDEHVGIEMQRWDFFV